MGSSQLAVSLGRAERMRQVQEPGWVGEILHRIERRKPALLIGNEWVAPHAGRYAETINPSTGRAIGRYAIADDEDVDAAVRSAQAAQPAWAALSIAERGQYLLRLREFVDQYAGLLATLDAIDAGLPVERMFNDIDNLLNVLREWPALAMSLRGQVLETAPGLHYTRYSPYGVVGKIVAFNHPILFAVKGVLAALMAGNTVVLKAADQTPLSALFLGDFVREIFPPGVFNVLTGDGDTGAALVSHPFVRRIAFIGSVRTGRSIQESAAKTRICSVTLELGGKNAMIVFPDAAPDQVARDLVFGMNFRANGGQSCGSTSRLFVHRDIYDRVVEETGRIMAQLTLGHAYDPSVDMGPLISQEAVDRVHDYIRSATAEGARLVTGGLNDPRVPDEGYFVAPTLFADVPESARIAKEEIFGPVVAAARWGDYEEVMAAVNAVEYGLTASIWTNDLNTALTTADRMECGYVWINDSTRHYFGAPFGGWKDSGVGRDECAEELLSFLQVKSVHVKLR